VLLEFFESLGLLRLLGLLGSVELLGLTQ